MNTPIIVAYSRGSFVRSFCRKRIQISDCHMELWRPLYTYTSSWIASTDMVTACGFAFHIRRTTSRPIYDSTLQKSGKHFSTISFPRRTHLYLIEDKFNKPRLFPVISTQFQLICFHCWNSESSSISRFFSSHPTDPHQQHHRSVLQQLKRLENSLRFHGYSTIRIGFAVFIVIGLIVYLLRDPIRENVAVEVSQVASRSLEHEHVAIKAEEFAKSLLQTLLHDDNMRRLAAQFIKQVLNSPETRKAGIDYLSTILEDPQNRQLLASTIKQVLLLAIHDPETTAALKAVVVLILSDSESQKAARSLITAVFKHEELKAAAALFFADVLKSQAVIAQATKLGKDVTFSVITDPTLKEETGKSFWQAVKYSFTPSWFLGTPSEATSSLTSSQPASKSDSSEIPPASSSSPSQEPSSSSPSSSPPPPPPSSLLPLSSQRPPPSSSSLSSPPLPGSSTSSPSSTTSPPLPSSQTSVPAEISLAHSALTEEELCAEQILDEDSNILT